MFSAEEFSLLLDGLDFESGEAVAVAVSGGPDSMALGFCLARWAKAQGCALHVLSVDHGMRSESVDELAMVEAAVQDWGARFQALKWAHDGVEARLQEEARRARYDLMAEYCRAQGIGALFLGHHMDDQAETFLFRLAKGSGLDGLSGMRGVQNFEDGLCLVRPFLGVAKSDLIALCEAHDVPFICDPSNEDEHYARGRLRQARAVLEAEGLSSKRLALTARRLERARAALDHLAGELFEKVVLHIDTKRIVFDFCVLRAAPEELALRCVLRGLSHFRGEAAYQPRFEKIEALFEDAMSARAFRKRTLGGVIFERDDASSQFILSAEL